MLTGKLIDLYPLEKIDLLTNLKWANNMELINLTGIPKFPKTIVELENWYNQTVLSPNNKFFAIKTKQGEYIGNVELNALDWVNRSVEIGMLIGEQQFWGKGIGKEIVKLLLNYLFKELNLHRIYLEVIAYNERAVNLYKKCGFREEGRLREAYYANGKYWDIILMAMLKKEFEQIY